jgi:hypothetical protein
MQRNRRQQRSNEEMPEAKSISESPETQYNEMGDADDEAIVSESFVHENPLRRYGLFVKNLARSSYFFALSGLS